METHVRFHRLFYGVFAAYTMISAVGLAFVFHPDVGLAMACLGLLALWPGTLVRAAFTPRLLVIVMLAMVSLVAADLPQQALVDFSQFAGGIIAGVVLHHWYRYRASKAHPMVAAALAALIGVVMIIGVLVGVELPTDALRLLFVILVNYSLLTAPRPMALTVFVAGLAVSLAIDSKTVLATVLCGAAVAMALRHHRTVPLLRVAIAGSLMAVIGLGLLSTFAPARLQDLVEPSTSISTISRLELLRASIRATFDNPLVGIGPSGLHLSEPFQLYYSELDLQPLIAAGMTRSLTALSDAGFTSGPHNLWADIASSYGLPMLVVIVTGMVLGWRQAVTRWLPLKLAVLLSIAVMGMGWHYSVYAYGTAALGFSLGPLFVVRGLYSYQPRMYLPVRDA